MKKKIYKKLTLLQFIITANFFIYSILYDCNKNYPILKNKECVSTYCSQEQYKSGECIIDEPLTKIQWLTDIIIFENTNGDISLYLEPNNYDYILFSTSTSNNAERIFYGMTYSSVNYIFKKGDECMPYIKKNINLNENREILNPEVSLIFLNNLQLIFSIGTENSKIDFLDINNYTIDFLTINSTDFLNGNNRIIKGISSLCFMNNFNFNFLYGTVISKEDDPSNYFLIIYNYIFPNNKKFNNEFYIKRTYSKEIDLTKGEYASCFIFFNKKGYISCFYQSKENLYKIINIENSFENNGEEGRIQLILKNTTIIGSPSNSSDENLYFLKGIPIEQYQAIYCYYSGENNNIPTFLIKKIDVTDFSLSDLYLDIPVIKLYDYTFNNGIKYNDITKINEKEFYFVSTNNNKDKIIIAYIKIYKNSLNKYQLIIRYYIIKLLEYYNIQILNGFKAVNYNQDNSEGNYLTLALDFYYYDSYVDSDEIVNNAALIFLSYPNNTKNNIEINFIEYAFDNNKNYMMVNLTENFIIENNIFGYNFSEVRVIECTLENGIEYYHGFTNEFWDLDEDYIYNPLEDIIKIDLTNYEFYEIQIKFDFIVEIKTPDEFSEFNKYCDKINDTLGNRNDEKSYNQFIRNLYRMNYYININQDLSKKCDDPNCILCLGNHRDYCLVCRTNIYEVYHDNGGGKLKICHNLESTNVNLELTDANLESINANLISTNINLETTNINLESMHIKIEPNKNNLESTNINLESIKINQDIRIKLESTNVNLEWTNINIETTNINLEPTHFKLESTKINLESTNINLKSTNINLESTHIKLEPTNVHLESSNINLESTNINSKSTYIEIKSASDNFKTTNINFPSTNIEIESTNIILLSSIVNLESTNSGIESENFIFESTNLNMKSTNINLESTIIILESTNIYSKSTNVYIESTDINLESTIVNLVPFNINLETTKFDIDRDSTKIIDESIITEGIEDSQQINGIGKNNFEISLEDLFDGKYKDVNLSNEQIKELYEDIKDYIYNEYNGENTIINTSNVKVQISTIEEQKDSKLSNIDLGKCGEVLKKKYCKEKNDSLIMLKFDIIPENETSTYVQYEIYSQMKRLIIELKECTGTNVVINVPIEMDSEIESLYNMLAKFGYNLFDSNDAFYNDICAIFTTENGTDILLYDRRMDIYQSTINISLCQEGCKFKSYNIETKKAECDCPIQEKEIKIDLSDINFDKNEMVEAFYETLDNSNFRVLKCYKLIFNIKVLLQNIGSIIMAILFILFLILIIIYFFKSSKKINFFIQSIIRNKYLYDENFKSNNNKMLKFDENNNIILKDGKKRKRSKSLKKSRNKDKNKKKKIRNSDMVSHIKFKGDDNNDTTLKNLNSIKFFNQAPPKKKNNIFFNKSISIHKKALPNKRNSINLSSDRYHSNLVGSNIINYNTIIIKNLKNQNIKESDSIYHKKRSIANSKKNNKNMKRKNSKFSKLSENLSINSTNQKEENSQKSNELDNNIPKTKELNDREMNSLDYEKAVELDKRTYCQYYFSLLKKKQLILFTFIPTNDYNLMSLKLSLFLVSFSLYLNMNAFFFNDETMHKIYKNKGVYNILFQIPQIVFSTAFSTLIKLLLKTLSLSEINILKIKEERDMISTVKRAKSIERLIRIKFYIFFIISILLMVFFWYFISCFCAVYSNTQIILFKDTLISFGLSMFYPFGINLLPGIFRIPSLRAKKKDKECVYSMSKILALI